MTRSCKNKSWVTRSPSSFSNQQLIKSPFSSQIHKMKAKSSGKKVRKYRPFPHKSQHVLDLERQLATMQERLKAVEERQEKLEAESSEASGPRSSGNDFIDTEPRRSSRRSRLREEDTARASTSGRSTLKRKRRTADTDSDDSEGTMIIVLASNKCSSFCVSRSSRSQGRLHSCW